jgi:hypothetical protein
MFKTCARTELFFYLLLFKHLSVALAKTSAHSALSFKAILKFSLIFSTLNSEFSLMYCDSLKMHWVTHCWRINCNAKSRINIRKHSHFQFGSCFFSIPFEWQCPNTY